MTDGKRGNLDGFDGGSTQILDRIIPESGELKRIPTLIIMNGVDTGKIFRLTKPSMALGRESGTEICVNDNAVSRKHCLFVCSTSSIMLIDLQSSNGTLLNGNRIEREQLKNGDKIKIGQTVLRFEIADLDVNEYNEKLYEQITIDDLTSLYNRKSMLKELTQRFSDIHKYLPFSILFLDIDHFKKVNDSFGHITGSKILTELGRLLLSNLRSVDLACRYGGEEFVLIISQNRSKEASYVAEKLRILIENHVFTSQNGERMSITVSIGVAEAMPGIQEYHDLIDRADKAMYQAKSGGRNRTVLYMPGDVPKYHHIK